MTRFPLLFSLLALLAGCTASIGDAPSLAPRDIERQPVPLPDAASEPTSPADPVLAAHIATILATAERGHARFEAERARTAALVARAAGTARGGEAWLTAQQALSALDAAQAALQEAAAAIDGLRQDPANSGSDDRAAIEAASSRIDMLQTMQSDAASALAAQL